MSKRRASLTHQKGHRSCMGESVGEAEVAGANCIECGSVMSIISLAPLRWHLCVSVHGRGGRGGGNGERKVHRKGAGFQLSL
jgi:hypothetical protein